MVPPLAEKVVAGKLISSGRFAFFFLNSCTRTKEDLLSCDIRPILHWFKEIVLVDSHRAGQSAWQRLIVFWRWTPLQWRFCTSSILTYWMLHFCQILTGNHGSLEKGSSVGVVLRERTNITRLCASFCLYIFKGVFNVFLVVGVLNTDNVQACKKLPHLKSIKKKNLCKIFLFLQPVFPPLQWLPGF